MTRQGIHVKSYEATGTEMLRAAGVEVESAASIRLATVHVHLKNPSQRMKRIMEKLDSIPDGHKIKHKGVTWKAVEINPIPADEHKGHMRRRGAAIEYFLEEVV